MTSVFPRRKLAEAVTEVKRARAAGVREGASKWGRDGCRQALGGACRGRLSILPDLGVSRWPNRCEWPKGVMDRDLNGSGPFLIGRCLALSFSSFSPLPPLSVVAAVTAVHAVHDGHQRSSPHPHGDAVQTVSLLLPYNDLLAFTSCLLSHVSLPPSLQTHVLIHSSHRAQSSQSRHPDCMPFASSSVSIRTFKLVFYFRFSSSAI